MKARRKSPRRPRMTCGRSSAEQTRTSAGSCCSPPTGREGWRAMGAALEGCGLGERATPHRPSRRCVWRGRCAEDCGRSADCSDLQPSCCRVEGVEVKSKFKKPDDLIFPNSEGNHLGHDNLIKRRFQRCSTPSSRPQARPGNFSPVPRRFNWHAFRHFAVSCWIRRGSPLRRRRRSLVTPHSKSRWIATATCSPTKTTRR